MSKKRKIGDPGNSRTIPSFFGAPKQQAQQSQSREPGTKTQNQSSSHTESPMATSSNVKTEPGEYVKKVPHKHRFSIQFESKDNRRHEINCRAPQTVHQAIRSLKECPVWAKSDKNLMIQRSEGDPAPTIATHFPCCLIKEDEKLTVSKSKFTVEEARDNGQVLKNECYSVFYIHHKRGTYTAKKDIFISRSSKLPGPLCVYGEKGITAEEALEQDGRFKKLGSFKLIDCDNEAEVQSSDVIDDLCERKFMIELLEDKQRDASKQSKSHTRSATKPKSVDSAVALGRHTAGTTTASNMAAQSSDTALVTALSEQRGISVMKALSESSSDTDREVIYKRLRDQFSELKKLMESRVTADFLQEELKVREEKFGKMRQSFKEALRLRKMISLGESVCKVIVGDICTGTGFVLIDNFIMTNAHLFDKCRQGNKLREGVDVHVIFNYEDPLPGAHHYFKVEGSFICSSDDELDYAVLQVGHEVFTEFLLPTQTGFQFPSGLLERVEEMPKNGEACIIGHPGGNVKQIDLTFIIEMEKREQAAEENLPQYEDKPYGLFVDQVKAAGIDRILMGGDRTEKGGTYNTFMYHGASGSPLFDAQGSLCGLHTAGFFYEFLNIKESVIEYAYSMNTVLTHLVKKLREPDQENLPSLLEKMEEAAGKNDILTKIFGPTNQMEEPMEH